MARGAKKFDHVVYLRPEHYHERCMVIENTKNTDPYSRYGVEVTHRWQVWPDDPPRYKVCLRCHATRALGPDEIAALLPKPPKVVPVLEPEAQQKKKAKRAKNATAKAEKKASQFDPLDASPYPAEELRPVRGRDDAEEEQPS